MIIDSHVHIFPDKIAEKAVAGIRDFYDLAMRYDGRLDTILTEGTKAGVDKFLILSVATVPEQVPGIKITVPRTKRREAGRSHGQGIKTPGRKSWHI